MNTQLDTSRIPSPFVPTFTTGTAQEQCQPRTTATPFVPGEPKSWDDVGVPASDVAAIAQRFLLNVGQATGRTVAEQLKLPFGLVQELLRSLKNQLLVQYRGTTLVGDYEYELTSQGLDRARRMNEHCTYCGSAPVSFDDYVHSVQQQSIHRVRVHPQALAEAYADLLLSEIKLSQIGQAIAASQGLFLYGPPGNGKSSIAERLVRAIGDTIWIPRTIAVAGDLMRLYDPATHVEVCEARSDEMLQQSRTDRRWVRIRRPTVIIGGELTLAHLDVMYNPARGINEAPLQLKSNGGALVVDDFGRQRNSTTELLNRFIVPLEKQFDLVSLPSGRQIQIPFDSMLVFATNLEPKQLFDEAFLRRLPYKFAATDPTAAEFRTLFEALARQFDIKFDEASFQRLLKKHYEAVHRPFRFCHPRDLLAQIGTLCEYHDLAREMTPEAIDVVAHNYFAGL